MKTMRWITGEPYGLNGSGACARWSAAPSNGFGGHGVAAMQASDAVKLTAPRPLGIEGGTTG